MNIRMARHSDADKLLNLYAQVARNPGGLARLESEVSQSYIADFLGRSLNHGLILVADNGYEITGEIHAYCPDIFAFGHVLSNLTICVHPDHQGNGVGRALFETFMFRVRMFMLLITRVELIARESNGKALRFYESLGFNVEGRFRGRIRNLDFTLEDDIPMGWVRSDELYMARQAAIAG